MEDTSFVKIYRKMTEWEWYTDPLTAHLFIHLILKANYTDKTWKGIAIKRGEFITSINKLSLESGVTIRGVRTCLSKLTQSKDIATKATNKYTLITICNYGNYQHDLRSIDKPTTSRLPNERQSNDTEVTNDCQTIDNQTTTTKERLEYKEDLEGKELKESFDDDCKIPSIIIEESFFLETLKIWNNTVGDIVPKVEKLTLARKRQFKTILHTMGDNDSQRLDTFSELCLKIHLSDYLSGRLDPTFSTDWDWVMKSEENWRKIADGKYTTRQQKAKETERYTPEVERNSSKKETIEPLTVLAKLPSLVKIKN